MAQPAPYAERWRLVQERLQQESRAADDETKLAQLDALMASVDDFGWRSALDDEDDRVRRLWCKLRQVLGAHGG